MLIDSRLLLDEAHNYTATAASTNVVDLGVDRDIGPGQTVFLTIQLDSVADDGDGDETYEVVLQTDSGSGFGSPTSLVSVNIPRGTAAGTRFFVGLPATNERYLRTRGVLGGTTPDITLSVWVGDAPAAWTAYPDAT